MGEKGLATAFGVNFFLKNPVPPGLALSKPLEELRPFIVVVGKIFVKIENTQTTRVVGRILFSFLR